MSFIVSSVIKLRWTAISLTEIANNVEIIALPLRRRRRNIYARDRGLHGRGNARWGKNNPQLQLQHARHRKHKFINEPAPSERTTPGRPGLLSSLSELRIGLSGSALLADWRICGELAKWTILISELLTMRLIINDIWRLYVRILTPDIPKFRTKKKPLFEYNFNFYPLAKKLL